MKKTVLFLYILYQFLAISFPVTAQYKVLLNFNKLNGAYPYDDVIVSGDTLYGMTSAGGSYGHGVIFSLETNGSNYHTMHDFVDSTGSGPYGDLTLSGDTLYGMTYLGGAYSKGVIFSILRNGNGYSVLRHLGGTANDPVFPIGNLSIIGSTLYGMSSAGGLNGLGNIFSISTQGNNYFDLYDFNSPGGTEPQANLTVSGTMLYGTTYLGGPDNDGVLFSFNTGPKVFKTLYSLGGTSGEKPQGSLLLSGSTLYGMATFGGNNADSAGTIFSVSDTGNGFADLFDFNGANGKYPYGSLILSGGKMYGMATGGGLDSAGLIFSADTDGSAFTHLHDFNITDGSFPHGCLIMSGNVFYGMAYSGGLFGYGVIFSYTDSTTGINETQPEHATLNVYPNPSAGIFTISLRHNVPAYPAIVEIYNMLGQKITVAALKQSQSLPGQDDNRINISEQPNGIYFYRVTTTTGDLLGAGKLVIQK